MIATPLLMTELGHSTYFAQGGDIGSGVSTWLARLYPDTVRVARWTEMPVGGHFAALEQPRALASDIHGAFSAFR